MTASIDHGAASISTESGAALTPEAWNRTFTDAPNLCSTSGGWRGPLVRRWRGTCPDMQHPPLDHHYVVLHLGGPKRIVRRRDGPTVTADAPSSAITIVPAGGASSWSTEGPIEFAHIYLEQRMLDRVIHEEFDREAGAIRLVDAVGRQAPLMAALFTGMLEEIETPSFASRLVLDSLLHNFMIQLLVEGSTLSVSSPVARHSLAPRRLRRVLEFIEANLGADISLEDLAEIGGSSRYHFSRAFQKATGQSPYRYLILRRIECAKLLLRDEALSLDTVARHCGFNSQRQFSAMFKQTFGMTPSRYRTAR